MRVNKTKPDNAGQVLNHVKLHKVINNYGYVSADKVCMFPMQSRFTTRLGRTGVNNDKKRYRVHKEKQNLNLYSTFR